MNIVLTGFMGTGKSTVGRLLSRRLGLRFVDLDELIEADAGMPVSEVFSSKGEAHFREMESGVIRKLAMGELGSGLVLSTGGGAVTRAENLLLLKGWGRLVCLKASVDEIMRRVGERDDRPLLARDDRREVVETLLKEREGAYGDCDLELDTTGRTVEEVAGLIERYVRENEEKR